MRGVLARGYREVARQLHVRGYGANELDLDGLFVFFRPVVRIGRIFTCRRAVSAAIIRRDIRCVSELPRRAYSGARLLEGGNRSQIRTYRS